MKLTDGQLRLRELLKERGATQRLADLCGVAHSTISRLASEPGRQPVLSLALALSNDAGIPVASWLRATGADEAA